MIQGLTNIGGEVELRANQLWIRHRKLSLHLRLWIVIIKEDPEVFSVIQYCLNTAYLRLEGPICLSGSKKSKE